METPLTANIKAGQEPPDRIAYERAGGYQALRNALAGPPKTVLDAVKHANLRGRGGAGFPTGQKWSFVSMGEAAPRPKYLVINADEMEPGAFKDRLLLEGDPHSLLESSLIAAFAIEAEHIYLFLREEYRLAASRLARAIAEAREGGYVGSNILGTPFSCEVHLHTSAGRYMCGEETGLLNALEGKRATPRAKPPFPQTSGLFGRPTIVNNVETICNVRHIVQRGSEWFRSISLSSDGGTKIYGVSGKVKRPGLWELPMGTPVGEILDRAGGMQEGLSLRGLLPGGASTDFLSADQLDVKMDFDSVQKAGSRLGTGTVVVLDDRTCPVGMVLNLTRFFAHESCGWCTPCREGLPWGVDLLAAIEQGQGREEDLDQLADLCHAWSPGHTFCALAPGAAEPVQSALKLFHDDFMRHIRERSCPWKSQKR